ncbi:MAG TPA: TolC family protein, partial [Flavobacteriales bacterium]|nr:TolC family protein [Flavobacteriales bacterium]
NEALLYNAQALLVEIENAIKIIENAFSTLLGRDPQTIPRTKLSQQVFTQDLDVGIPIQLLDNRPDVLAAEYNLVNAFELTNVAHASMYPALSISASAGLNSQNFDNLFSLNSLFATVLGNLTQPIFNQRRLKTNKEVAKSKQEIAFLDYKQTILQAYSEVSNALYAYNANTKSLVIKKKENDALVKAIEYSEELQGQGLANYLEVLRAKDNALNTQLSIIDLELTKLQTITNLYQALGGGWK